MFDNSMNFVDNSMICSMIKAWHIVKIVCDTYGPWFTTDHTSSHFCLCPITGMFITNHYSYSENQHLLKVKVQDHMA